MQNIDLSSPLLVQNVVSQWLKFIEIIQPENEETEMNPKRNNTPEKTEWEDIPITA